jgi:hypothetical protein
MIEMHAGRRNYVKDEFLIMMEGSDLLGNHEFWHSENADGARNYSGKAGWPDLAKRIIRDLEDGSSGAPSPAPARPQPTTPQTPHLGDSFAWQNDRADHLQVRASTIRPTEVRIGETFRQPIRNAVEIPLVVGNWIIDQGRTLPVIPNLVHPANSGFLSSAEPRRLKSGHYVNVHGDQKEMFRRGRRLLDASGLREVRLQVILENGSAL